MMNRLLGNQSVTVCPRLTATRIRSTCGRRGQVNRVLFDFDSTGSSSPTAPPAACEEKVLRAGRPGIAAVRVWPKGPVTATPQETTADPVAGQAGETISVLADQFVPPWAAGSCGLKAPAKGGRRHDLRGRNLRRNAGYAYSGSTGSRSGSD
jgi:hypothetical protein